MSQRSTLLTAIDDVLRQPCMSDNGDDEAEELLQVIEENHRRKRRHHRQKGHTC
jgi:hypothetical protein